MEKKYNSVIITGSVAYDEIMDFPGKFADYIQKDKLHQINVSFVVDILEKQLGGTATNIAYNTSLLTKKKITVLSAVGKDGKQLLNFYKKNNISTEGILIDKNLYTATGKVITDMKDNQIWGYYYGALKNAAKIKIERFLNKDALLIISANHKESFIHFQKEAIKNKADYLYDPGMAMTWISEKDLLAGVLNCKILIGNDYEISFIMKKIKEDVKKLVSKGKVIITTLGEEGVVYEDAKVKYAVSAFKSKKVKDPTGAGDAWRGGFISGIFEGLEIDRSLLQGNALASFAIEKYGTVNHRPSRKDIARRIKALQIQSSNNK